MLNKKNLLSEFQKTPEKHWKVDLFEREGFSRKECKICKNGFWSISEKEECPEHGDYGFIGQKNTKVKWDYVEAWKEFEKFFKNNNHTPISRYPVISRWHPTLFFTQASIQDFQRFDGDKLEFDYPENPLIVPQACLRFNDIENVGITGRHMTCFVMAGQHAFNDGGGYWKDKCLDLNFQFLSGEMGIPKEDIVYTEDMWAMNDMSAFGPSMEAYVKGLEIVNNVFMQFQGMDSSYKELPLKVIDVGWGFSRLPWLIHGTPTIYDSAFGPVVDKLKKELSLEYDEELFRKYSVIAKNLNIEDVTDIKKAREDTARKLGVETDILEKKIGPMEAAYALLDHSRSLAFAISDGGLPSNVGGGYNLRVIARRAMSFINKFGWDINLGDIALWHANYLKSMFPELEENKEEIEKVLQVESKKFRSNRKKAKRLIESFSGKEITTEKLVNLYDSEGITPEQLGVEVPPEFYDKVTEKHNIEKKESRKSNLDISQIPATDVLYYTDPPVYEFEAKIVAVINNNLAILDKTAFYPTGGGQMNDTGMIDNMKVTDVFKIGKVILHRMFGDLKAGNIVKCSVDKERREKLMLHHDAVHLVNGATKKILGSHVNQAGSEKDIDKARLDITHYEMLTEKEVKDIENLANEMIKKNLPITKQEMPRGDAEKKYGFRIYQGGYVPSKDIRVVEIEKFDIEACGGTHGHETKDIGLVKIIKTKKITDGLVRIELKAGQVAIDYLKERGKTLEEISKKLGVAEEEVPGKIQEIFNEWKSLRKRVSK